MKLEAGKRYVDAKGDVRGPLELVRNTVRPVYRASYSVPYFEENGAPVDTEEEQIAGIPVHAYTLVQEYDVSPQEEVPSAAAVAEYHERRYDLVKSLIVAWSVSGACEGMTMKDMARLAIADAETILSELGK